RCRRNRSAVLMPNTPTSRVVSAIARHLSLDPADLNGVGHHKTTVLGRHVAMYVLREHQRPKPSFPELEREFGRDHTTIISAVRRIAKLAPEDELVRELIEVGARA